MPGARHRALSTGRLRRSAARATTAVTMGGLSALPVAGTALAVPAAAPSAGLGAASEASPCAPEVKACAQLSTHRAWLTDGRGDTVSGPVAMNDGAQDTRTPTGRFTVQWKDEDHRSGEFDGAAMPYSVFFDGNGRAFHAGDPARQSAGCIRLATDDARVFFANLQPGDGVEILP